MALLTLNDIHVTIGDRHLLRGVSLVVNEGERIGLLLTISHATQQPGPVDPDSAEIHKRLQKEFLFQSLRVIERRHIDLRLQEVGGIVLPTGKRVSVLADGSRAVVIVRCLRRRNCPATS